MPNLKSLSPDSERLHRHGSLVVAAGAVIRVSQLTSECLSLPNLKSARLGAPDSERLHRHGDDSLGETAGAVIRVTGSQLTSESAMGLSARAGLVSQHQDLLADQWQTCAVLQPPQPADLIFSR